MTETTAPANVANLPASSEKPTHQSGKPYATPSLSALGNVRDLTRAGQASSNRDFGGANMRKLVPQIG
jgi:hypothetical protein